MVELFSSSVKQSMSPVIPVVEGLPSAPEDQEVEGSKLAINLLLSIAKTEEESAGKSSMTGTKNGSVLATYYISVCIGTHRTRLNTL